MQAVINYCLNKYCPYIIIAALLYTNFNLDSWEPYILAGLILFIDIFNWRVVYSVAYCDARGVEPGRMIEKIYVQ